MSALLMRPVAWWLYAASTTGWAVTLPAVAAAAAAERVADRLIG